MTTPGQEWYASQGRVSWTLQAEDSEHWPCGVRTIQREYREPVHQPHGKHVHTTCGDETNGTCPDQYLSVLSADLSRLVHGFLVRAVLPSLE